MKIQYKSFANESDVEFKWGRSLDTMFEPGSYTIEIDNIDEDIGLPDEICSDEHYIVGNLVVTDSGTKGHRQDNRVIGQILTFTSRESKETKIYSRSFADGKWSEWTAFATTNIFDNISTTDELVSTVAGLVDATKELQAGIVAEKDRAVAAEAKIKGTVSAIFDFTTGSTANWQSRKFAYKFTSGNNYHIKVVSDEVVATTYFSVRTADGTAVKNNILTGKGTREIVYKCEGDGDYLYMTIQSNGVAFAYNVEIQNISEVSMDSIARELSQQALAIESIEKRVMKIPSVADFTAGCRLDYYGNIVSENDCSATEQFFYISSNTAINIKGCNYTDANFVVVYDVNFNVIHKTTGVGGGTIVEYAEVFDSPTYIRISTPTYYLKDLVITYDGECLSRDISLLENRVVAVEDEMGDLGKTNILNFDDFEIGNITMDNTGWGYWDKKSRVRMKAGVTYHLFVGNVIILPAGVKAYLGFKSAGAYNHKSWFTGEFVVKEEGDYKILLSDVEEAELSSKFDLLSGVIINGGERRYENKLPIDSDSLPTIRVINHRGYNSAAPENTLPAFELSKRHGYRYVETDVYFTADGVPVCLHDGTIDRTSNGSGHVRDLTLEELKALDFGSWFSPDYAGTTIPTLEEFLILCKQLGLKPYIEIKTATTEQVGQLVNLIRLYGMEKYTTFISFNLSLLQAIVAFNSHARVGYLANEYSDEVLNALIGLRESGADAFANLYDAAVTDDVLMTLRENGFEVEAWIVDRGEARALKLDGVTTDGSIYWEYSGDRPVWRSVTHGWKE